MEGRKSQLGGLIYRAWGVIEARKGDGLIPRIEPACRDSVHRVLAHPGKMILKKSHLRDRPHVALPDSKSGFLLITKEGDSLVCFISPTSVRHFTYH